MRWLQLLYPRSLAGAVVAGVALVSVACGPAVSQSQAVLSGTSDATSSSNGPSTQAAEAAVPAKDTPCPATPGPQYPVYAHYAWHVGTSGLFATAGPSGNIVGLLRCGTAWGNYTLNLQYKVVAGGYAEIAVRGFDDQNYMLVDIRDTAPPQVSYWGVVKGAYTAVATKTVNVPDYKPGGWHDVQIQMSGSHYTTSIDGVSAGMQTYTGFYRGTVGFRNCCGRQYWIRDMTITNPSRQSLFSTKMFTHGGLAWFEVPQ